MSRQEIYDEITEAFGMVPEFFGGMTDVQLEHQWGQMTWVNSDTALTARDKLLVAYGASAAIHCQY